MDKSTVLTQQEESNQSCLSMRLYLRFLFEKKSSKSDIPHKINKLKNFPCITPKVLEHFPFYYYRCLGSDIFQAVSYAFFELCIRNRDHLFFKNFIENKDSYYFFKNIPKDLKLSNYKKKNEKEYQDSFNRFVELTHKIKQDLCNDNISSYTIISEFYDNLKHSGVAPFFKIFMRGYILGRIINELDFWKHCTSQKDFKKNFKNFSNFKASSFNPNDLNLICSYIVDHIAIYILHKNQQGEFIKFERKFLFPESSTNIIDKQLLNLIFENNEFYCLYYHRDYARFKCHAVECEKKFRPSWVIACVNHKKHYLCLTCFEKKGSPEQCQKNECSAWYEEKTRRIFMEKAARKLQNKHIKCPLCDYNNEIPISKTIYNCKCCHEKLCQQHSCQANQCYCVCPFCENKTQKIGDLFFHQRICGQPECEATLALQMLL